MKTTGRCAQGSRLLGRVTFDEGDLRDVARRAANGSEKAIVAIAEVRARRDDSRTTLARHDADCRTCAEVSA